jgi:hypothetical protein
MVRRFAVRFRARSHTEPVRADTQPGDMTAIKAKKPPVPLVGMNARRAVVMRRKHTAYLG